MGSSGKYWKVQRQTWLKWFFMHPQRNGPEWCCQCNPNARLGTITCIVRSVRSKLLCARSATTSSTCSATTRSSVARYPSVVLRHSMRSVISSRIASSIALNNQRHPNHRIISRFLSRTMSTSQELPPSKIPIFTTVAAYREWRNKAFAERKSVGFVATMGALHAGHLSLGAPTARSRPIVPQS